jgi:hypothetical protein
VKRLTTWQKSVSLRSWICFPIVTIGVIAGLFLFITHPSVLAFSKINADSTTVVSVDTSQTLVAIPPRYLGFSYETSNVCNVLFVWDGSKFEQLIKNIGPQVMRFGGNSADKALWDPTGQYQCSSTQSVLTQQVIDALYAFEARVDAKLIWTVNLGNYAPSTYSQEASYVLNTGGSNLLTIEIGNEPDLYNQNGTRTNYTFNQYLSEWGTYRDMITSSNPNVQFGANDSCCYNPWLTTTAQDSSIALLTRHLYPTSNTSPDPARAPTIDNLLSASLMQRIGSMIDGWVQAGNGVPVGIIESNSASHGGQPGVSNAFAATLWGGDYLFTALEHGAKHLNFHTGGGPSLFSPIDKNLKPTPLYYAMLFFHYAAPDGNVVSTQVQSTSNVTAHSVVGSDGKLRVALFNKDQNNATTVQIRTSGIYTTTGVLYLTAPSVSSTSGVTFGGSAVAADGTWRGTSQSLVMLGNSTSVTLAPGSAAVVVMQ